MTDLAAILFQAAVAALVVLAGWIAMAVLLRRRGLSRWRAVPLGATLLVAAAGYGLYWKAFFSSSEMAVQLHAVKLAIAYFAGGWLLVGAAAWCLLCALPLLARRKTDRADPQLRPAITPPSTS